MIEIYDEMTGEWAEIPGVTSVEIIADTTVFEAGLRSFRDALTPAAEAVAAAARTITDAWPAASDQLGREARRTRLDRPAWQSPYGPPPRRR
ncbi:hypothetical protein OG292_19735 [Streptomyces sp. NBC_01511]|uniref:hypothetical protein n=1 Tax=Streptomyces sp. NBC_01511 TaxID=2903889 RepID=UPI0038709FF5